MVWNNALHLEPHAFQCGHCGNLTASNLGFSYRGKPLFIYLCAKCEYPTFFKLDSSQIPPIAPGEEIQHLPKEISMLYLEARKCISIAAFTASTLAFRKLLMHIAVERGAEEQKNFLSYIEFLESKGYIPPNGREWVDLIRKKGNEANHEIILMNKEDAEELLLFTEMLLRFMYEFSGRLASKTSNKHPITLTS